MTKIIGHRGAAGLALENSLESIKEALRHDLEAIEFDVHLTRDGKVIVLHDSHTKRVAEDKVVVSKKTLAELRKLSLHNSQQIPTLDEVLDAFGKKLSNVIIDIKDHGVAERLPAILKRHSNIRPAFASFKHEELRTIHKLLPGAPVYVLEHFSPIDIFHSAHNMRATGVGLNKWLMNPLSYRLAKRYHLQLYVYTLNSSLLAKFFQKLYPDVIICTDYPDRLIKLTAKTKAPTAQH